MIHPHEITIGSLLRTNKGEIIRVESISTKRQHRKVGYHTPDDPYRIKYARLAQCEGIELTPEILEKNGWKDADPSLFQGRTYVFIGDSASLTLNHWNDFYTISIGCCDRPLVNVHQLQFALICAGLPELAMNLKVE